MPETRGCQPRMMRDCLALVRRESADLRLPLMGDSRFEIKYNNRTRLGQWPKLGNSSAVASLVR